MRKNKDNLVVKEDAAAHAYKFVKKLTNNSAAAAFYAVITSHERGGGVFMTKVCTRHNLPFIR